MRAVSNNSRPSSDSDKQDQDRNAYDDPRQIDYRLIKIANTKRSLLSVLTEYSVPIKQNNSWDIWSESIVCPLLSHKGGNERTPSFAYNFQKDYFHCFGCNASGRAVEFISDKEGIDKFTVAEQILEEYGSYDLDENIVFDDERYDTMLFDFATFIGDLYQKHKYDEKKIVSIEKVIWWMDIYFLSKVPKQKIIVNELSERIERAKELLSEFCGQPESKAFSVSK